MHACMHTCMHTYIHTTIYIYICLLGGTSNPLPAAGEKSGLKGASPPRPGTSHGLNPCRGMRGRGAAGSPTASRRRPAVPAPFRGVLSSSESSPYAGGFRPCSLPGFSGSSAKPPTPAPTSSPTASTAALALLARKGLKCPAHCFDAAHAGARWLDSSASSCPCVGCPVARGWLRSPRFAWPGIPRRAQGGEVSRSLLRCGRARAGWLGMSAPSCPCMGCVARGWLGLSPPPPDPPCSACLAERSCAGWLGLSASRGSLRGILERRETHAGAGG